MINKVKDWLPDPFNKISDKINISSDYVQELIRKVFNPIEHAGFKCYFVGGCVRDSLLGVTPHDWDIVTDALPSDLRKVFSEFSDKSADERGVTMPIIELLGKREIIEIATFRKDGKTIDGRHTYVEFGGVSMKIDSQRRDFTINAMYADKFGNVIDPTEFGKYDLEWNLLRFVGNPKDRIKEDYLRALRFCRFASKLGFTPVQDTKWKLGKNSFKNVSKERQCDEFIKLMSGKCPSVGVSLMYEYGIFDAMGWSQEINDLFVEHNSRYHKEGNVWVHTLLTMEEMEKIEGHDWIDMAAAFFHDFGKKKALEINEGKNMANHATYGVPIVERLLNDIKVSKKDTKLILWLVENHMKGNELPIMTSKLEIWRLLSNENFKRLERLAIADARATINDGFHQPWVLERSKNPKVREVEGKPMPERLVNGNTLLENGFNDVKSFENILEVAYKNQINGNLDTVEKVLNAIRCFKK